MKKKQMTIKEYKNIAGTHTIIIGNARYQENFFDAIKKILKYFFINKEVFFGFYRTDGINLTLEQQRKFEKEIPLFFKKNGNIQNLNEYLTVAKVKSNNYTYDFITSIFDYYLETIMFNSNIDWQSFKQYHLNYQEHRIEDIIFNNFSEILFYYFDSGDFLICFNPQIYNPKDVRNMVELSFKI